jgi:hypothetical protein
MNVYSGSAIPASMHHVTIYICTRWRWVNSCIRWRRGHTVILIVVPKRKIPTHNQSLYRFTTWTLIYLYSQNRICGVCRRSSCAEASHHRHVQACEARALHFFNNGTKQRRSDSKSLRGRTHTHGIGGWAGPRAALEVGGEDSMETNVVTVGLLR